MARRKRISKEEWAKLEGHYRLFAEAYARDDACVGAEDPLEPEDLGARLEQAVSEYNKGGSACRTGMIMALRTTVTFLRHHDHFTTAQANRILRPLEHLVWSLERLEVGVRDEVLDTQGKPGGTRLRREEAAFRLLCVAQYQILTRSMTKADEYVAGRLHELGYRQHRKDRAGNGRPITANTIRQWSRKGAAYLGQVVPSGVSLKAWILGLAISALSAPHTPTEEWSPSRAWILDQILPSLFSHLRVTTLS